MGGAAREWIGTLDVNIVPGSEYTLDLVMSKYLEPSIVIGYQVSVR